MRTSIYITGQIGGNHTLLSHLNSIDALDVKERMFYAKEITFPTKKAAKKALWEGYKSLKNEKKGNGGSIPSYSKASALYWDASKAEIIRTEN